MAFKIFRKNCCGLDVHKTWIYACIGITDPNGRTEYKQARFSSFTSGALTYFVSNFLQKQVLGAVLLHGTSGMYIIAQTYSERNKIFILLRSSAPHKNSCRCSAAEPFAGFAAPPQLIKAMSPDQPKQNNSFL